MDCICRYCHSRRHQWRRAYQRKGYDTIQLEVQESGTIGLDVKSDSFSAVSLKSNQDDISKFYLNVGIKGSYLEGEVLETVTGIECVSTMKVLDAARAQKIDIITISKSDSNYKSLLSTLESNNIPAYALEEITEKVEAGCKVITPIKNVRINSWNGIGYIINNANEYSFMLSNGTNGGETTEPVRECSDRIGNDQIEITRFCFINQASDSRGG